MEGGLDHGIVTMGGGGDFPRNVTVSPLSGVEKGEYFNVRPLKRAIQDNIENALSRKMLAGEVKPGDVVTVDAQNGVFTFTTKKAN
mgnify:CR=1 FL=1